MHKLVVGFMLIMLAATVSGCFIEPYPYRDGGGGYGRHEGHEGHGDRR
jgi:hypothetical protein